MEVQSVLVHVSWTMSMFSRHFHGISMEKPGIHGKMRKVHGSSTADFQFCFQFLESNACCHTCEIIVYTRYVIQIDITSYMIKVHMILFFTH